MENFSKSSIFLRSSLFVSPVACLLQVIGMACPNWFTGPGGHSGLWKGCSGDVCVDWPIVDDWLKGVRALEVLGFLVALGACVLIALSVFLSLDSKKRLLTLLSLVACFVAGLFIMIGVILFVVEIKEDMKMINAEIEITDYLSWAFGLCITSAILLIMCGVLVVMSIFM